MVRVVILFSFFFVTNLRADRLWFIDINNDLYYQDEPFDNTTNPKQLTEVPGGTLTAFAAGTDYFAVASGSTIPKPIINLYTIAEKPEFVGSFDVNFGNNAYIQTLVSYSSPLYRGFVGIVYDPGTNLSTLVDLRISGTSSHPDITCNVISNGILPTNDVLTSVTGVQSSVGLSLNTIYPASTDIGDQLIQFFLSDFTSHRIYAIRGDYSSDFISVELNHYLDSIFVPSTDSGIVTSEQAEPPYLWFPINQSADVAVSEMWLNGFGLNSPSRGSKTINNSFSTNPSPLLPPIPTIGTMISMPQSNAIYFVATDSNTQHEIIARKEGCSSKTE